MRTLLDESGLPAPDEIEYGHTCIRLIWWEKKVCIVVDIDEAPPDCEFGESWLDEDWGDDEDEEVPSMN